MVSDTVICYHYRNHNTGKEIDAIIELVDGRWGAFEIKLGTSQIDHAAENLLAIQSSIVKSNKETGPQVLCVICGLTNYAYQRNDGVFAIPITALRD